MAFDPENLGYGAGGGMISAILSWIGFKSRLDDMDKRINDIAKGVVWDKAHNECQRATTQQFSDLKHTMDEIKSILLNKLK